MSLIICMAGLNSRFHNVGFDIPKYLLPFKGKTVIGEILENLLKCKNISGDVILIANERDMYFRPQLRDAIAPVGLNESNIVYIHDTEGQAETAAIGADLLKRSGDTTPLFIHNADTILYNRNFKFINEVNEAWVDCFPSQSPKYSYVNYVFDKVTQIAEKEVISPYASSGLYIFKNAETYLDNFYWAPYKGSGEIYISDVLKYMIDKKSHVAPYVSVIPEDTLVLGTPQEYLDAVNDKA